MDIDIDTPTSFDRVAFFPDAVPASMVNGFVLKKHPVGSYFYSIPRDPVTHLSAVPYKSAEQADITKIDFLHLNILDHIESKSELRRLMNTEPDWEMLQDESVVSQLFQLSKQIDLLRAVKPKSVLVLADCIALIRPSKIALQPQYLKDKQSVQSELWRVPKDDSMYFKKAHAISYALTIVVQLNMIREGIINT